ncbi:MAG: hypothetical protein PUH97_06965, partial [Dialister sp.]|nr:hypothetical protein [Dialister sp.]MDY5379260.1 hypothetical protein [Dialister sp.]
AGMNACLSKPVHTKALIAALEQYKLGEVQGSGLAHGAERPLITYEIGSAGSTGSEGSTGVVRRIKIWKRRGV